MMVGALRRWHYPGSIYLLIGGAVYLLGGWLITNVFNIPKNNALAAVAPAGPESAKLWADYLSTWMAWNHVRAVASLLAVASLTLGLCY